MVVNQKQTIMPVNSSQNSRSSTIVSSLIFAGFHTGSPVLTMPKKKNWTARIRVHYTQRHQQVKDDNPILVQRIKKLIYLIYRTQFKWKTYIVSFSFLYLSVDLYLASKLSVSPGRFTITFMTRILECNESWVTAWVIIELAFMRCLKTYVYIFSTSVVRNNEKHIPEFKRVLHTEYAWNLIKHRKRTIKHCVHF